MELPGWILSGLNPFSSSNRPDSFDWDRPATAHFKDVGRLLVMYSAHSFPVWPVAPSTITSYSLCSNEGIAKTWNDVSF